MQIIRFVMSLSLRYGGIHKIRHFACERDFYVFRNHMYKTYFEPFNLSQKFRLHANKTVFEPENDSEKDWNHANKPF